MIRAAFILLLAVCACTAATQPPAQKAKPPFAGCLSKPAPLPKIAPGEVLRARHDQLDALYDDCAARARSNAEAFGR